MRIYLASPTGFSPEWRSYGDRVRLHLKMQGHEVVDPWRHTYEDWFNEAKRIVGYAERLAFFTRIAQVIGDVNRADIHQAEAVLGLLDGPEPDSGTVGEICYASGLGKRAYGLRTDVRSMGDLPGVPINLQVLNFIEASGGCLFYSIDSIAIPETPLP